MNLHIRRSVALGMIVVIWSFASSLPTAATTPEGTWDVGNRVAIQVYECNTQVCGQIVWLRNPALRTPQMCGKTIVWGLTPDGPSHWTDGWFFDPENSNTYNLSADLQSEDTLVASIYDGIPLFGRTEILKRITPHSLDGWC